MIVYLLWIFLAIPSLWSEEQVWTSSNSEGFEMSIIISDKKVVIPNKFTVNVSLKYPKGYSVDKEHLRNQLLRHSTLDLSPFILVSEIAKIEESSSDSVQESIEYVLITHIAGTFPLTFMDVIFSPVDDESRDPIRLISDIFDIDVVLPESESVSLLDPKSLLPLSIALPIEISESHRKHLFLEPKKVEHEAQRNMELQKRSIFPWLEISVLGLLTLFYIALKYYPIERQVRIRNPEQQLEYARSKAFKAIDKLSLDDPFSKRGVVLADLVRKFIEEGYQLRAPRKTTQEFLRELTTNPQFSVETQQKLSQFLVSADFIKFADHEPSEEEILQMEHFARGFILS